MNLSITKTATVADIQQAFHHYFPYLKIEVFEKPHEPHALNTEKQHIAAHTILSEIPTLKGEGEYTFSEDITTTAFEQGLWTDFGLAIQILRKAGHLWLQTAQTDDWSLAKQNQVGENASHPANNEVSDYTLRDIE